MRFAAHTLLLVLWACGGCAGHAEPSDVRCGVRSTDHVSGVSLGLFASDPFWDYGSLIEEIVAHNATDVLVVIPLVQSDITSTDIRLTLPPETIQRTLQQVRESGLRLSVMPIVQLGQERSSESWRGVLEPADPGRWWSNYRAATRRLATWAERAEADRFFVGSELCSLEDQEGRWREIVGLVRSRFSGKLTYSANWDHYRDIGYWDLLDEVSVTAYFPVERAPAVAWRQALREMNAFSMEVGRPLLVSEYGYPAIDTAGRIPWDETASVLPDPHLQAELIATALSEMDRASVRGGFLWNWFGLGGSQDLGYSPRGRPSAAVIKSSFSASLANCHGCGPARSSGTLGASTVQHDPQHHEHPAQCIQAVDAG